MMRTFRKIIAIGLLASSSIGFSACENKAAKEAEAARIEQEKQEAINQALEEQKTELLREQQEQQAEKERLHQQAEQERIAQEEQQNSIAKFVGKYYFLKYPVNSVSHNSTGIIEVLPDGRVTRGGDYVGNKIEYIGTIKVVSESAFMINPAHRNQGFFSEFEFCVYRNGEDHEVGYLHRNSDDIRNLVFDISEKRAYRSGIEDYRNRDIGEVEYYKFTR